MRLMDLLAYYPRTVAWVLAIVYVLAWASIAAPDLMW